MPDSSGSGAQQAVKTWPTRASLGTAAPPATRRSRPRPARAPMGGEGAGLSQGRGLSGLGLQQAAGWARRIGWNRGSVRDVAPPALRGGVGCVVPSLKRDGGIIAWYGAISGWQRSCGDDSASGRRAGRPTTWAPRLVVAPSPNVL